MLKHCFDLKWHSFGCNSPPASDMIWEIWVMRASPAVAQGIAGGEKWWGLRRVCNKCKCPWRWGGTSCCGESCQLTMGRGICGLGKDPEHVRELVGGMWGRGLKLCQSLSRNGHSHRNGYWHIVLQGTRGHRLVKDKECPHSSWSEHYIARFQEMSNWPRSSIKDSLPFLLKQNIWLGLILCTVINFRCLCDFHLFWHTFQTSTWCRGLLELIWIIWSNLLENAWCGADFLAW